MRKIYFIIATVLLLIVSNLYSQDDRLLWRRTLSHIGVVNTAIFSSDETMVINGAGKYIQSRDLTSEILNNFDGGDAIIRALAISPDGKFIYSGAGDDSNPDFIPIIIKWDFKTGVLDNVYEITNSENYNSVESIDVSPDGKYLAATFRSKQQNKIYRSIALWNIETTELIKTSDKVDAKVITKVEFSPDSKNIIINVGRTIEKLAVPTLEVIGKFGQSEEQHLNDVRGFDFSNDGEKIATVAFDGFIKLWDFKTGELISSYKPSSNKKEFFKVKLVDNAQSVFVSENESPNLELYSLKYKRKFTSYKSLLSDIKDFTVTKDFQKILVADSSSLVLLKSNYNLVNGVEDVNNHKINLSILPNPISNIGEINYLINSNGFVNIRLYNYQGIVVKNILRQYQNKGKYQIELDSYHLNSGIYYLMFKTNKTYTKLPIVVLH